MRNFLGAIKHFVKRYKFIYNIYNGIRNPRRKKAVQNQGVNVIQIISTIFNELKIVYFVDFGTLLGFIREKTFISHDIDIDIGIPYASDLDKSNIEKTMLSYGFSKVHEFKYNNCTVEQAYKIKGVTVDLFYYNHDSTNSYCYSFYRVPEIKYPSVDDFSTFKFTYKKIQGVEYRTVNGITVSVPNNPEDILIEKYGEDWKVPNKNWNYWQAPTIKRLDEFGKIFKY